MTATLTHREVRFRSKAEGAVRRPIRKETEYAAAVSEIEMLLDADPKKGTAAFDRLELLTILVEAYEAEHHEQIKPASPQEMVEFMAEQKGISRTALAELMGGRSRLSDFLNKHRKLSINQVRKLRDALGIPADLLIGR